MRHVPASITSLGIVALIGLAGHAAAQSAPDLGAAEPFALIGSTTVDNTGATAVTGDIGALGAVTGFPPGNVTGTIYPNSTPPTNAARDAAIDAFITLGSEPCLAVNNLSGQDLGGLTLLPGVYCFNTTAQLTGTLTLNALEDPAAVFIFQIGSTLTTAAGSAVTLINSAAPLKVFWRVGTVATLGASTSFNGTMIATNTIGLGALTSWTGRAIALNQAITLNSSTVVVPMQDLVTTKNAVEATVAPGGLFTYQITVDNTGTATAEGVTVSDPLPSQLTFISSTTGCSAAAQLVTCGPPENVEPGEALSDSIVVRLNPAYTGNGSDIGNVATASSDSFERTPATNASAPAPPPAVLTPNADLSITKAPVEATVSAGQQFTYHLVVTNAGPSTAVNVGVGDTLPVQLTFVSSPQNCAPSGGFIICPTTATLAPGGTLAFDIVVQLDPAYTGNGADILNQANVGSATADPVSGNNAATAGPPTIAAPQSDLQLVKSVSAGTVTPGSTFTYTVQVTNNGPSRATNVVITDPLPTQTTFVSSVAGCTAVGRNVTCPTAATLAVGATLSVDIVVQLDPAYTGDGSNVLNSATATAATTDPVPANNTNPAGAPPLVGAPGADVTVVKTVSTAPVTAGNTFTYSLLVSNQGPSVAANVATTDLLPAGITFVSSGDGCLAVGQQVTCPTIATLTAAGSRAFGLVVRLDPNYAGDGSDLPNRGVVSASTMDPVPGNNTSAPVTPNVGAGSADLSVLKVALGDSVSPGGLFTYRVSVTNAGPSAAFGIILSDSLPAPLTFVASVAGCTAVGQVVTCQRPTMPSGTTVDFDIVVRLAEAYVGNGSDLANVATVAATTADPDTSNNTTPPAPPPPLGFGAADLTLTKTGPAGPIAPNSEITYTLVVTNQGPNAATGVVVQDPTPAGLTFIATSGACVTAFPCTIGTLLAGQAATISARYNVGSETVITNTATVSSPTPDPSPGTNTASATTPSEPRTYYLAEGATGTFWGEDISIANPNTAAAPVTMTFFTESGAVITHTLTVAATSHATVRVNDLPGLASTSTSTNVTSESGLPLAVERTMTWDATMYGGHTETAASELSTTWYFAEGALGYFDTFLLLGNAQATPTTATVTFLLEGGPPVVRTVSIGAHARLTLGAGTIPELNGRAFGIAVVASQPIVAERSMYFGSTETRLWSGGHASGGVSAPSRRWFYAEGATGTFFDTFILMSNPQTVAAHVTMEYLLPNGTVITAAKLIPAQGRLTVSIEREADVRLHAATVSTRITSDVPIVTERSMYWASKPDVSLWSEGHNSFGVDQAAPRWGLAGGRIGGPNQFKTFVLLANPWTATANVTVTYVREGEPPVVRTYVVPPTTRYTIDVGASAPELEGGGFGAAITVTNGLTITVERSIYWNANGVFWTAGTNAAGTRIP